MMRNLYLIFRVVPDEADQGMIYRLLYFHVPAWWTAFLWVLTATLAGIGYLVTKRLAWDALAAAMTEVGTMFLVMGLALGSIWAKIIWGIWWTWDPRLTSALVCVMMYCGYLILRSGIDEPHRRAKLAAVVALFISLNIPLVWFSIRLWRTQHPQPMQLEPDMMRALLSNWAGMILLAAVLTVIRYRQELAQLEIKTLRRESIAGEN